MILALILGFGLTVKSATAAKPNKCTTIQDESLTYSAAHYLAGEPLTVGYDIFGYNYQGRMFNGSYANAYLGGAGFPPYEGDDEAYLAENPDAANHWTWPYRDIRIVMKWNDAWLANTDCDGDGKLDRHYGYTSYINSGAWETNHMFGEYQSEDEKTCNWNNFVKIVAAPTDAYKADSIWYTANDVEIGTDIWGEFALIHEVYNDPCDGYHGLLYSGDAPTGFGYYMP